MRRSFVMRCLLGLAAMLAGLEYSHGQSTPVFNPTNGHHYVRFDSSLDWFAAQAAASASTLGGVNGYLATITSQAENDLIAGAFPAGGHWLGGFQPAGSEEPGGGWEWVTGEPWSYTSWGGSEPNNAGGAEDGLNSYGNGVWNDATRTATTAYIVEYPTTGELFRWANVAGGDVATAANWSSSYLPAATDPAVFDLGSTGYVVTAAQNRSFSQLQVGTDNVTLDLGTNTLDITGTQGQVLRVADGAGDNGVLRITSGTVKTRGLGVAATDGSSQTTGLLEIDGPVARLEIVGTYNENQIGGAGADYGELRIRNGGQLVAADDIYVARNGGRGLISVAGANSLVLAKLIWVGLYGVEGTVNVVNGGRLETTDWLAFAADASTIGHGSVGPGGTLYSQGLITVGYAGTADLNISGGQVESVAQLQVGDESTGDGTVIVSNGGTLVSAKMTSLTQTSGILGVETESNGVVVVQGVGSKWTQDGSLGVGWRGGGRLEVTGGGLVESVQGQLGRFETGSGSAEVTDAGSLWDIAEGLSIGGTEATPGGQGSLEVSSGGLVKVGTVLRVWESGAVDVTNGGTIDIGVKDSPIPAGTINVSGRGRLNGSGIVKGNVRVEDTLLPSGDDFFNYSGVVAPGNGTESIGRLTIEGNFSTPDGGSQIEIDLAGTQSGSEYDQLRITGHAALGGRLEMRLANSFVPSLGNSFDVLDWGTSSGAFSYVSLPILGSGLAWNTKQLYTSGVLSVGYAPQVIGRWTFEAGKPGNPVSASGTTLSGVSPAIGAGIASGRHASGATVWDNPAGNGSTESMSSNNWAVGDYYQFSINTADLENITLEFEQVSSSSGPRDFQLQYSTDGTAFTDFGAPYAVRTNATPAWNASTPSGTDYFYFDLSSLTAINDQSSVFFRLTVDSNVSSSGGVISTGGTSRLDNVTIWGTQVLDVESLAGDYDGDLDVDGADFLAWQRQLGASVPASTGADGNGDGVVDAADYTIWRDNFGNTSGSGNATTAAVPEPASIVLLFPTLLIACRRIRSRIAR